MIIVLQAMFSSRIKYIQLQLQNSDEQIAILGELGVILINMYREFYLIGRTYKSRTYSVR